MTSRIMNCEQMADALQDYLEQDAAPEVRAGVEAHAAGCADCAALITDLHRISAEASQLPALVPSRDLWAGIAGRIDAPVVPIESRRAPASRSLATERRRSWRRPALAAAALVVITAGTTHLLTRAMLEQRELGGTTVATDATPRESRAATDQPMRDGSAQWVASSPISTSARGETLDLPGGVAGLPVLATSSRGGETPPPAVVTQPAELLLAAHVRPLDAAYEDEVTRLRLVLAERRADLDSSTVAIVERNLSIIDLAIQESRAALARDPASLFLNEQLNHALERKIELLRVAASMPSRS
jgi:hypothetical protein